MPAAVTANREVERKFAVHGLFVLPDLVDPEHGIAAAQSQGTLTLRATYYDAPDLRLAREGITLRHRAGEGPPRWTLKLPAGGSARDELEVAGTAGGAGRDVPAELRDLLVAWLRGAALQPVATLRTSRQVLNLCGADGELLAEVVDDTVSVLEGRRVVSRFREVEVEDKSGAPADDLLAAVTRRLRDAGASDADPLPKVVRALGPRAVAPGEVPPVGAVVPSDPAAALVAASLRAGTRRLMLADIGVRRREEDAVHQMRVSCRRMRSDLKTFRPLVEPLWGESLRAELRWLATSLGDARDLEVLRERLRGIVERVERVEGTALPYDTDAFARLDAILAEREERALGAAAEALTSERYLRLLDVLVDAARNPVVSDAASAPCSRALPPLVRRAWDRMAKRCRKLHVDDPDETWHEARIAAKAARYAAEAVAPVLGKHAERLAVAARHVQEVLGEHQDAAIAAETVLALAVEHLDDGPLCLVCGRLVEANRAAVDDTRRAFPPVWRKAVKAG